MELIVAAGYLLTAAIAHGVFSAIGGPSDDADHATIIFAAGLWPAVLILVAVGAALSTVSNVARRTTEGIRSARSAPKLPGAVVVKTPARDLRKGARS